MTNRLAERKGWIARIGVGALDWLYPPVCGVCGTVGSRGEMLCAGCHEGLGRLREPFCDTCGEHYEGKIEGPFSCPNCSGLKFAFEFARPAMLWDERTRAMIHRLKYGRGIHLAGELAGLAAEALADERFRPALEGGWPLVPVPLHRSRLAERHFNQAEEIARGISRRSGLPLLDGLRRTRATSTQTRLSRSQRLENLKGAFEAKRKASRREEKEGAILVDDVLTTGSTLDACARALKKAGFRRVFAIAVMRG